VSAAAVSVVAAVSVFVSVLVAEVSDDVVLLLSVLSVLLEPQPESIPASIVPAIARASTF
jgi:hypothetical protein